jgi:Ca-activated chloride channel family protein
MVLRASRYDPRPRLRGAVAILLVAAAATMVPGCSCSVTKEAPGSAATPPVKSLELVFTYGSEKEAWIQQVTSEFNASARKTAAGSVIRVNAIPLGSGECIDELLEGRRQADLTSPASAAFIRLGNGQSRAKTGQDLVASTENLVLSPVVIAMWKPMAEAIGWGTKRLGWSDILALARDHGGWTGRGYPQWGDFRFGHTHPQYSNSGLISLIAEVYAATRKTGGLSLQDVNSPAVASFVGEIERSVVHYGSSTGFFGNEMFSSGPRYLSAAVLYENMVIQAASRRELAFPVVAIYPKEGTFWSDHPVGIVERPWVTPERREAAKAYIEFLLARPQQERAIAFGFRPGLAEVPVGAPIDAAHGADPREPQTTLEVPSPEVINAVLQVWQRQKKRSDVALVLDTSGSMKDDGKLVNAREGAKQLIALLGDEDEFSLIPFSSSVAFAADKVRIADGRAEAIRRIDGLFADGKTVLYDAVDAAYQHMAGRSRPDRIQAIVVLTDGEDTGSRTSLGQLLARIGAAGEAQSIRVFTIAYGREATRDPLRAIAAATHARAYEGNPQTIRSVFKDVSTFF